MTILAKNTIAAAEDDLVSNQWHAKHVWGYYKTPTYAYQSTSVCYLVGKQQGFWNCGVSLCWDCVSCCRSRRMKTSYVDDRQPKAT